MAAGEEKNRYDLIVIGGGITGMTAAIYAARANLKVLVLEKHVCGGLVNSTHVVENFPSYPVIGGMELMEKVREHVDHLGVDVREVVEIDALDLKGEEKRVGTDEGVFTAPAAILATGRMPRKLPVEEEFEQLHYCAICDGTAYKGKDVVVVGAGNSGVDESMYLLSLGVNSVLVVEGLDRMLASERSCEALKARPEVEVLLSTTITGLEEENRLPAVELKNGETGETFRRKADGIFVYIGQEPQTEAFGDQVATDDHGYILADENMATNLPGVFAAGDVIAKRFRQITTAMGDATIAALSVADYLANRKK